MFVDDQPNYPMTFVVQLDFSGKIDRQLFQKAVDQAMERHPMLRAVVQPAKSSRGLLGVAQVQWMQSRLARPGRKD